jgi:hypothetical protein
MRTRIFRARLNRKLETERSSSDVDDVLTGIVDHPELAGKFEEFLGSRIRRESLTAITTLRWIGSSGLMM